jgi:hypothetical protein
VSVEGAELQLTGVEATRMDKTSTDSSLLHIARSPLNVDCVSPQQH